MLMHRSSAIGYNLLERLSQANAPHLWWFSRIAVIRFAKTLVPSRRELAMSPHPRGFPEWLVKPLVDPLGPQTQLPRLHGIRKIGLDLVPVERLSEPPLQGESVRSRRSHTHSTLQSTHFASNSWLFLPSFLSFFLSFYGQLMKNVEELHRRSIFQLPPSTFHLPTSDFGLPPFTFHLPISTARSSQHRAQST